jgi:hypothetical protein
VSGIERSLDSELYGLGIADVGPPSVCGPASEFKSSPELESKLGSVGDQEDFVVVFDESEKGGAGQPAKKCVMRFSRVVALIVWLGCWTSMDFRFRFGWFPCTNQPALGL